MRHKTQTSKKFHRDEWKTMFSLKPRLLLLSRVPTPLPIHHSQSIPVIQTSFTKKDGRTNEFRREDVNKEVEKRQPKTNAIFIKEQFSKSIMSKCQLFTYIFG